MALDPSIILQARGVQLDNPLDTYGKVAQVQQARNQNRLADMTFADSQRERAGENSLSQLLADGKSGDDVVRGLASQGYGARGLAYGKQFQDQRKTAAEIDAKTADVGKTKADTSKSLQETAMHQFEIAGQLANAWVNNPGVTKAQIQSGLNAAAHSGVISPQVAQAKLDELSAIGDDPKSLSGWANGVMAQVMKAKDAMAYIKPDANAVLTANTARANNAATNAVAMRGQNMTDARLGSADASLALGDDAILSAAHRYNVDGTLPPMGMGKNGATGRTTILNKAAELAKGAGVAPEDQRAAQITNKANSSAMAQIQKQKTMVGAFERNFIKNADIALEMSQKVDRSGVPIANKWINAGKRAVAGDPDLAAFDASVKAVANEYAKIVSGSMGNTATAMGEIKKIEGLLNTAQTPQQVASVIGLMKRETKNRMDGFDEEIDVLKRSMRNVGPTPTGAPVAAPAKPSLNDIFGK